MKNEENKKKHIPSCLVTFFLAGMIITLGMGLAGILPGGHSAAVFTDTLDQMASMQAMLARQISGGGQIFYSFKTSLGQNTALLYAFCAYSPFTLIYIFISDIYTATIIGMILKIALSAMCFHLFLQYGLRWEKCGLYFFSLCYGLCGFQFEYMLSTNLLDALYLLPLVMLALMHALRKQRFIPLVIAYAASFMIQFYCGFLIGIFSAASMLMYLILKDGKEAVRKNLRFLLRYCWAGGTAVLISMVLLMPAISFFMSNTGFNSVMVHNKIAVWDLLFGFCFGRPTSLMTDIPFMYCGLPVVFLLPLYFAEKTISRREKVLNLIMCLSLVLTLYIDPLYYFLHAFNRPDGFTVRYAFIYVFLFVTLAARICRILITREYERKKLLLYAGAMLLFSLTVILLHANFGEGDEGKGVTLALYGTVILTVLWTALLFLLKNRTNKAFQICTFVLLICELTAQAYHNCLEQGLTSSANERGWDAQTKEFVAEIQKAGEDPEAVYRAHLGNAPNSNQSAMYDYMGIAQFASSNYETVQSLMSKLGDAVVSMRYTQAGATDATDMIFGIRYRGYLTRADAENTEKGPRFEVYERALPLGYMAATDILATEAFDGNPFENQNRFLSALCGERIEAYMVSEVFGYEETGSEYGQTEEGYYMRTLEEGVTGELLIGIPENGYDHAYIFLQLLPYEENTGERVLSADMATNVAMFSPADRKDSGARFENVHGNAIMEMTRDGNAFVVRIADFDRPELLYRWTEQYFCYQNEEELDRAHDILSRNTFRADRIDDGYLSGRVVATEERPVLFFTIPYDEGWTALVDGKPAKLIKTVRNSFISLKLEPGEHTVTLEYEAPGAAMGRIIALAGVISLLLMLLYEQKQNNKNMHESKKNGHQ